MDTTLSNQVLYSTVIGALLPPIVAVLVQAHWPKWAKAVAAMLVFVAAGAGIAYYQGALDAKDIGRSVMLVVIAAKTLYESFWKPTGIAGTIERATSAGGMDR